IIRISSATPRRDLMHSSIFFSSLKVIIVADILIERLMCSQYNRQKAISIQDPRFDGKVGLLNIAPLIIISVIGKISCSPVETYFKCTPKGILQRFSFGSWIL